MPITNLMRMHNVSTRRRDRINSDEEERTRMGYEIKTGVRFQRSNTRTTTRQATVMAGDGTPLLRLTYGQAATIWRMNLGWQHAQEPGGQGFHARHRTRLLGEERARPGGRYTPTR